MSKENERDFRRKKLKRIYMQKEYGNKRRRRRE